MMIFKVAIQGNKEPYFTPYSIQIEDGSKIEDDRELYVDIFVGLVVNTANVNDRETYRSMTIMVQDDSLSISKQQEIDVELIKDYFESRYQSEDSEPDDSEIRGIVSSLLYPN